MFKMMVCVAFLLPSFAYAQQPTPDKIMRYKTVGGVGLDLHVFLPQNDAEAKRSSNQTSINQTPIDQTSGDGPTTEDKKTEKRAAIVFFFGGGWIGGSPAQFYPQARALADRGMIAMAAAYRVQSRHQTTPFECVKDGKSAIRWVRQHCGDLGVDPDRVVAAGGSAGGHVAACTGMIAGVEEDGEDTRISSAPNAMILFNPVLDTTEKGYGAERFDPEQQTAISPCHHVREDLMPTLIFHGNADKVVPFENAQRFNRLMKEAGNLSDLVTFEGRGHGFFNSKKVLDKQSQSDFDATLLKSIEFLTSRGFIVEDEPPTEK